MRNRMIMAPWARGGVVGVPAALAGWWRFDAAMLLLMLVPLDVGAQQVPDTAFRPAVESPAFAGGIGPRLCLDEAHHNFHTLDNRFFAFGALARRDGFRVGPLREVFTADALAGCDILVISNAQPSDAEWDTYAYPTPSAFSTEEIVVVRRWVEGGGRLLLIADHMPLAGAASLLAAAFTSQAFRMEGDDVRPVLVLPDDYVSLEPRIAWRFEPSTPVRHVGGWLQGATRRVGSGRVALFGEAAMFSAQIAGAQKAPMGMNSPMAEQNARFVLNVLRWLAGVIEP